MSIFLLLFKVFFSHVFNKNKRENLNLLLDKVSKKYKLSNLMIKDSSLKFNVIKFLDITLSYSSLQIYIDSLSITFNPLKIRCFSVIVNNFNIIKVNSKERKNKNRDSKVKVNLKPLLKVINYQITKIVNNFSVHKLHVNVGMNFTLQEISISSQIIKLNVIEFNKLKSHYLFTTKKNNTQTQFNITRTYHHYEDLISADSIIGLFDSIKKNSIILKSSSNLSQITINHKNVSDQLIQIENCKLVMGINVTDEKLNTTEDTSIEFGGITFHISHSLDLNDFDFFAIDIFTQFKPESIIKLLPSLYQKKLRNLKSHGDISLLCQFGCLKSNLLTHKFKINYELNDFSIHDPGVDLNYLLSPFEHKNFDEYDVTKKPIIIIPFSQNQIKESLLERIILLTEDPLFFTHKGFDINNIGKSIAVNMNNKKIKKGASTITMQIVKNLLLGNKKNISRKIEEIILTLLIETYYKIDKHILLNIYTQLIKFSSNVYGIENGAKHYFNKKIIELNIIESIVLSYIIPRPDFFEEAVRITSDQLNKNLSNHIDIILEYYFHSNTVEINNEICRISSTIFFANDLGTIKLEYSKYLCND